MYNVPHLPRTGAAGLSVLLLGYELGAQTIGTALALVLISISLFTFARLRRGEGEEE